MYSKGAGMIVRIDKVLQVYVLSIGTEQQVYRALTANTFLGVLDMAVVLQLHVNNLNEWTFETMNEANQYLKGVN
jgi:hypothetical protein